MKLIKRLYNLLFKTTDKPIDVVVSEVKVAPKHDKVAHFNKLAPQLFGDRLKELGYELKNIEESVHNGVLWSTHHYYVNDQLNLTLDMQQAPYYTDYGFSIFLFHTGVQDHKLICHVPHELQDSEDKFLIIMRDKFFSDSEILSLLRGEVWQPINHLRYTE